MHRTSWRTRVASLGESSPAAAVPVLEWPSRNSSRLTFADVYDIMSDMKVTVRELQRNLSAVLDRVRRGATVNVTKRGEVVATLVPPSRRKRSIRWPDFLGRMQHLGPGGRIPGAPASEVIDESRGDRP